MEPLPATPRNLALNRIKQGVSKPTKTARNDEKSN